MADIQYWFARYRPGTLPRRRSRGLLPIHWKGPVVIAPFVIGLVLFLLFGPRDRVFPGLASFVLLAIASFSFFLWAAVAKSDPVRIVYDDRPELQRRSAAQATGDKT